MDDTGHFSFGTANDFISTRPDPARGSSSRSTIDAPVFGDSLLHLSRWTRSSENHCPLPRSPTPRGGEDAVIGPLIAEQSPTGQTIQLGFGSLPAVAANHLTGHKDLGIHTELLCPSMADLIQTGVAERADSDPPPPEARLHPGPWAPAMYDFMDDNPAWRAIRSPM